MEYYQEQDLKEIVLRSADIFKRRFLRKVPLKLRAAQEEPRIANRLLKRVRDFAQVNQMAKSTERCRQSVNLTASGPSRLGLCRSKIVENND